jgi:drug/metabolite transporter (DMT)-like permease
MKKNVIIWLAIFSFNLFSSFTHIAGKEAVIQISPWTIAFFRSILAVFVLWIMIRVSGKTIFLERVDSFRFVILGALAVPLNQLAFITGLKYTPVSHPAILYATTSAWVLIISVFIGVERLRWWKWIGVGFSIVGVFVLMGNKLLTFGDETIFGDVILLFAVLSWSLYTVICKPIVERYGALETTFLVMTFGALLYFPFGLFFTITGDHSSAGTGAWLGILYLGILTSGVAYYLWIWLLERIRPSQVAVIASAQPPTTVLLAWFVYGEIPSLNLVLSIVIVLSGIIFMVAYGGYKKGAGAEDS